MQNFKKKFQQKTGERLSTVQSCIRTNDIDLWGDGTHFCFFRMVGCFSFGNKDDYPKVVDMWLSIMVDVGLEITSVHVHPDSNHRKLFEGRERNYHIVDDTECIWSDGTVGGYCSEFYVGDVEIGNIVNPMGDSVDVGFGLERMCRLLGEQYEPTYDLEQFLEHCWKYQIKPGSKGKNHTVKKILRRWLRQPVRSTDVSFDEWILEEEKKMRESFRLGERVLRRHLDKPDRWWLDTFGLLPEEVEELKQRKKLGDIKT